MISAEFDELDHLEQRFSDIESKLDEYEEHGIPCEDLFSTSFMNQCSSFSSLEEFFASGGFEVKCTSDIESIPENELDRHVASCTTFNSWEEMFDEARSQFMVNVLGI
ncbi:hypothetical protein MKC54_11125 [[Clostridium] innocuum]|nr:hypothetical protein [[Clostridium] innocuum]MCR0577438.1 hypothetical protein [[Clostridium] innocuum]